MISVNVAMMQEKVIQLLEEMDLLIGKKGIETLFSRSE